MWQSQNNICLTSINENLQHSTVSPLQMVGGSPQVMRKTGEGNDITKLQVCQGEKLKLGSEVRERTESRDFITSPAGELYTGKMKMKHECV